MHYFKYYGLDFDVVKVHFETKLKSLLTFMPVDVKLNVIKYI